MKKGYRTKLTAAAAAILLGMTGIAQLPAAALSEYENYYLGDISGNGVADVQDIIMLQKQLMGLEVQIEVDRVDLADIDRNDVVDIFDLGYLKKLVLGTAKPEDFLPEEPKPPQEPPVVERLNKTTPTLGTAKALSIFVEFADVKYSDSKLSTEALQQELFGSGQTAFPYESVSAWFDRASYGKLRLEGDCYYYTLSGPMADYMYYSDGVPQYEKMAIEVLQGLDEVIDYSQYDANGDGMIDCLTFDIPNDNLTYEQEQYWWGCTARWYENWDFTVDDMYIHNYIIINSSPYTDSMELFKRTMTHEMGHSMGLADYYVYGEGDHNTSSDGLNGDAGYERMDDSVGDFCSFSKLMLGWIDPDQVLWYSGDGDYTLNNLSFPGGSCLILPISSQTGDVTSEYFIVEFLTAEQNNADIIYYAMQSAYGVRIFHVNAELYESEWYGTLFKYDSVSPLFNGPDKERILRLVNDSQYSVFYLPGDVCTFGTLSFAGYDANGDQTIDTGYTVTIGEMYDDLCTVTVQKN